MYLKKKIINKKMFGMAVVSVQSTLAPKDRPIVEHCRQVFSIDCVGVYLDQMQLPFIHIIFFPLNFILSYRVNMHEYSSNRTCKAVLYLNKVLTNSPKHFFDFV